MTPKPCACAPGAPCPACVESYRVLQRDMPSAKGGSPACPACGKHSPTFPHPLGPGWFRCQKGCDINFPEMKP